MGERDDARVKRGDGALAGLNSSSLTDTDTHATSARRTRAHEAYAAAADALAAERKRHAAELTRVREQLAASETARAALQQQHDAREAERRELFTRRSCSAVLEVMGIDPLRGRPADAVGSRWTSSSDPDGNAASAERIVTMIAASTEWMIEHSNWPTRHADRLRQRITDELLSRVGDADAGDADGDVMMTIDDSAQARAADAAAAARAEAARRLLLRAALALLPEDHRPTAHDVAVAGSRKPLHLFAATQRNCIVRAARTMQARVPELVVSGMHGEPTRNLAALRNALAPRSSQHGASSYALTDLYADVAKDLHVLREASRHDAKFLRLARSLASVLAHERTGLSLRQLSSALGVTFYEAREARRHAHVHYAGAIVEKAVFTRVIKSEDVAAHLAGHRISHDVCRVREASMRNASSGAILERTAPIAKLYALYVEECNKRNIAKKQRYKRTAYYKYLGAAAYCDPRDESACCEICLEFIDETLEEIGKTIDDMCLPLRSGAKHKQLRRMLKAVKVSLKTGEFASHQTQTHDPSLMHDTMYALSDPHDARLCENCDHELAMDCAVCNGPFYLRDEMSAVVDYLESPRSGVDVEAERISELRESITALFGMRGLLRGMGHLVRDRRQSQYRVDIVRELMFWQCFMSDDYCSKLERMRHRMGKSEGYGGAKVSLHGTQLIMRIPPPDTPGVDWSRFPAGARDGAAELQGKYLHVFIQIYCDDSEQDAWHAVNVHRCDRQTT